MGDICFPTSTTGECWKTYKITIPKKRLLQNTDQECILRPERNLSYYFAFTIKRDIICFANINPVLIFSFTCVKKKKKTLSGLITVIYLLTPQKKKSKRKDALGVEVSKS